MKTLLIVGIPSVLILGWLFYIAYPLYRSLQITKGVQAAAVAYQQHPANPTMRFLVAGDSTGVGAGAVDPQNSTAGRLGGDFPTADITNISVNGLKLAGLQQKLAALPTGVSGHYDLILIQIGANDIVQMTSMGDIKMQLAAVLSLAAAHGTHVVILTCGNMGLDPIFKFPLSTLMTYRTLEVRSIYMQQIGVYPSMQYVDLYRDAAHDIFSTDPAKYYAADDFHPTDISYGIWYESIRAALVKEGFVLNQN